MKRIIYTTKNSRQTKKLGEKLAKMLQCGEIICLSGELGSGKTTFAQGLLKGLGIKGPHTSPTFVVMKHYKKKTPNTKSQTPNNSKIPKFQVQNIYHIDCYRVKAKDILDLGWKEIIANKNNVVIVEWAEKIKRIIPKKVLRIRFKHKGKDKREIMVDSKFKKQNEK